MKLGAALKEIREVNSLTIKQLSVKSGVDASYITKIENGKRTPSLEVLSKVCDSLSISVGSLIVLSEASELNEHSSRFYIKNLASTINHMLGKESYYFDYE